MSELSDKILQIATVYLGPATEMFLQRQTEGHMKGLKFHDIKQEHLPELFKWIQISSELIIKDKSKELTGKLIKIFNVNLPH